MKLYATIEEEILDLKRRRKAVILAHNYQAGEVQDVADFVGDSLGLSQKAAKTDAEVIVFCGVHFMAETAAILCPDKTVLIPDLEAGCSLAGMVTAEGVRAWKAGHPDGFVVAYVNTSAAVKAESDYCCTSSNAVAVVEAVPPGKEILFIPDFYLGTWVRQRTSRPIALWPGFCHVHARIDSDSVSRLKRENPGAEFLVHPECGCLSKAMPLADKVLSTEGMARYAKESKAETLIVATETGILHRMRKESPRKRFIPAVAEAECEYMKLNTLEKLADSLRELQYRVTVPPEIALRARLPIERMISIQASPIAAGTPPPPRAGE